MIAEGTEIKSMHMDSHPPLKRAVSGWNRARNSAMSAKIGGKTTRIPHRSINNGTR